MTNTPSPGGELTSFPAPLHAVLIGATGGLGAAFHRHLVAAPHVALVSAFARTPDAVARLPKTSAHPIDLLKEETIAAAAHAIKGEPPPRLVVVATGILHQGEAVQPEKTWRRIAPEALSSVYAINTIGPALVAKHFLGLMPNEGKTVFAALSARVGSISDNRIGGWHAYRASKAALNMMLRCLAIERARKSGEAL
ncbi:MAG: SDR family NAD(P)-dependent oxidoreductase, partial [Pseudomonadota bacterium]